MEVKINQGMLPPADKVPGPATILYRFHVTFRADAGEHFISAEWNYSTIGVLKISANSQFDSRTVEPF